MDIAKTFATDEKLEIEGRWVAYDDKTSFKIARMGNSHHTRLVNRLFNQHKAVLQSKGPAAEAKNEEVMAEVFAKTLLVDWKGPVEIEGVLIGDYSVKNSLAICQYKEFRAWLSGHANDFDSYKAHQEAEDEGN